jgi:tetratricopeptide (TPR) repeat protein
VPNFIAIVRTAGLILLLLIGPFLRPAAAADRGYIGASLNDLSRQERSTMKLDPGEGISITAVTAGAPAAAAGLKPGDVVTQVNGIRVADKADFVQKVQEAGAGAKLRLMVRRNGKAKIVIVTTIALPTTVEVASGIANVDRLRKGGDWQAAIAEAKRLVDVGLRDGDGSATHVAALRTLWDTYTGAGAAVEAVQVFERFLAAWTVLLGPDHKNIVSGQCALGTYYERIDWLPEAEAAVMRGLPNVERIYGETSDDAAKCLGTLGNVLMKQGQYDKAEPLLKKVLGIRRAIDETSEGYARSLNNLGVLYIEMWRYDDAEPLLKLSLQLRTAIYGELHEATNWTAYQLSTLYLYQHRIGEAEVLLRRILDARTKQFGPYHELVAETLTQIGNLLFDKGEYDASSDYLRRATEAYTKLFGESNTHVGEILVDMAFHAYARRNWKEAYDLFYRASRYGSNLETEARPARKTFGAAIADLGGPTALGGFGALSAFELSIEQPERSAELLRWSFRAIQWAEAYSTGTAIAALAARWGSSDPEASTWVREYQDLAEEQDRLQALLLGSLSLSGASRNLAQESRWKQRIGEIEARRTALRKDITKDNPQLAFFESNVPLTIDEVQALLGPNDAVVQFSLGPTMALYQLSRQRRLRGLA